MTVLAFISLHSAPFVEKIWNAKYLQHARQRDSNYKCTPVLLNIYMAWFTEQHTQGT
jgi:hypothetical protein